ncbi:MAG: ABC transporter permease [Bacteroidales bacterium]|jgi:ABC-2 type transport system permease protein|nr:ABC transporter permease [Bacteroidales bacterium]
MKNNSPFSVHRNSPFIALAGKEFRHIFRDVRTILLLLVMPAAQIILFGFAVTTEIKETPIAVFDPSKNVSTARLIKRIDASEYFRVEQMLHHPDEITGVFGEGKIRLALVFGDGFGGSPALDGRASLQIVADATDPNQAGTLTQYLSAVIGDEYRSQLPAADAPPSIVPVVKMLYNPEMKSVYNFVPGVMGLIFLLICAMMTSISIVRERETGTMEVLLASPVKPSLIIAAKAVPYLALSAVNYCTVLLLSVLVLGVPVAGSLALLTVASSLYIVVSLLLGLFISTVVRTQKAAMIASGMGLMIPVMLLSGLIFPVANMPVALQWLSSVVPARWYIRAMRGIMIEGLPLTAVRLEIAVLCAMGVVLLVVSLKKFKVRLE